MRTIPSGFLDGPVTDLHVCWLLTRRDGVEIRGTECDQNIIITTGTYAGEYLAKAGITGSDIRSTSDLSVDNLEVTGALVPSTVTVDTSDSSSSAASLFLLDISPADIEAGLLDNAECVTFMVNSAAPDLYQHVLRSGWVGNVTRNDEGRYTTEMRGLTQALSQGILRTYSVGCDAELGDARCKVDLSAFITSGTVTVAESRREFQVGVGEIPFTPNVVGGKITWTSGLNTGYSMEIKAFLSLDVTLYLPMPEDIAVGDTFEYQPGCDKKLSTCLDSYNNIDNFRGFGFFVPGQNEVLRVGKR
jgi:uncharacterized phage protein (TIGR02218 family)